MTVADSLGLGRIALAKENTGCALREARLRAGCRHVCVPDLVRPASTTCVGLNPASLPLPASPRTWELYDDCGLLRIVRAARFAYEGP